MVICKFFLQGTCKFGDFCKFEHQFNDSFNNVHNTSNTSILRQAHFGNSQQAKPSNPPGSSTVDTSTLVKSVVNDMTTAEKGGQWLLSCYAPYKEKPAFPGFEDRSFEEIRFGYYEALKNGTLEQYKREMQIILQQAVMKLKSLQAPSPDIINLLKNIYNSPPSSHAGIYGNNTVNPISTFSNTTNTANQQQSSPFGHPPNSSIFAQANQTLFGNKSPQSQNNFGAVPNVFGNVPQNNSIFGGQSNNPPFGTNPPIQPQPPNSNNSVFGQTNVNVVSGGSIFGTQVSGRPPPINPNPGNNIFNTQSNNNSIFSGHQMNTSLAHAVPQNMSAPFITQAQTQTNIFAKQQQTNAFGSQNAGFPLNQSAPQTNIFATSALQNIPQTYGNTMKSPMFNDQNIFMQQNQAQMSNSPFEQQRKTLLVSGESNIFNNKPIASSNLISQTEQIDETIYSKQEDLTEEEIRWFESDDLDISNLPEKPPTYQMCFKS